MEREKNAQNVDVKEIMRKIKGENLFMERDFLMGFDEFSSCRRADETPALRGLAAVQAYRVMPHKKGFAGGIKLFFKKVARKFTWGFISPIVEDQNCFNQAVCDMFSTQDNFELLSAFSRNVQEQMELLLAQNNALHAEIVALQKKVAAFEANSGQ